MITKKLILLFHRRCVLPKSVPKRSLHSLLLKALSVKYVTLWFFFLVLTSGVTPAFSDVKLNLRKKLPLPPLLRKPKLGYINLLVAEASRPDPLLAQVNVSVASKKLEFITRT